MTENVSYINGHEVKMQLKSKKFFNFLWIGATTDNLPPGVLYRVKATYKYNREDTDELSFDVGEIIRVVEYDDPEEQVVCTVSIQDVKSLKLWLELCSFICI
jgi:SH3 domain.